MMHGEHTLFAVIHKRNTHTMQLKRAEVRAVDIVVEYK